MTKLAENIYTVVWAFPLVSLPFLILACYDQQFYHVDLIFKISLHNLGFTILVSFFYRKSGVFGTAVILPLLLIASFSFNKLQILNLVYFLLTLGLLFYEIPFLLRRINWYKFADILVVSSLLILLLVPFFSNVYSQPDSLNRLYNSNLNNDTLYHLSMSAIWKNYHVVSHGLHGLGELKYHFGSHLFLAGSSSLLDISSLESYSHFFGFFVIPVLFLSILCLSEELFPSTTRTKFYWKLLLLATLILGSGVLVSGSLLDRYRLDASYYQSESYSISLIFFLCFISMLVQPSKSRFKVRFLLIILALSFLTVTKVSSGFFGLSTLAFWIFFLEERKSETKKSIIGFFSLLPQLHC